MTTHELAANAIAERLEGVVRTLVAENAGSAHPPAVTLDSSLEDDLGLDSLGRAELLQRLETEFDTGFPEDLMNRAQTVRDLLRALESGGVPVTGHREMIPSPPETAPDTPSQAKTLPEVLEWHARVHPRRVHVQLLGEGDAVTPLTYGELRNAVTAVAAGLLERGLTAGESVAIMLPTGADYLRCFLGVMHAGGVPVPIYPPLRPNQVEDHLRRHARILNNAQAEFLIAPPEGRSISRLLASSVPGLRAMLSPTDLITDGVPPVPPRAHHVAMLQYTSGSTGQPKGVILTHANLLANIRAIGKALAVKPADVCVSWLPLYHDMGLIGSWLCSLYFSVQLVLMPPTRFLTRPASWLWAVHRSHGTISAAPNFAYELCANKVPEADLRGLDLSSWRVALNGAEPVIPATLSRFTERFGPCGFSAGTMTPVYGLAENAVGLAFPPLRRGPVVDRVARRAFEASGHAAAAAPGEESLYFVACGVPLPGNQIRIVDDAGREVPERQEGHLQFTGPSATCGYQRNPEATRALFDGPWLDSGDLAYMAGGEVFVTARVKDVILRAGRNIYPMDVDQAVGEVEGVRKGCVVTFAAAEKGKGTERLVVLAETRLTGPQELARLQSRVAETATAALGEPPGDVVLAPPHTVLKTSSGKVRRDDCRRLYESGQLGTRRRPLWWQYLRLVTAVAPPLWRRARRRAAETGFAARAWLVTGLLAPAIWAGMAMSRSPEQAWRVGKTGARVLARAAGVPLAVQGLHRLPAGGCVLVSNHASYLDSLLLAAVLPRPVRFVGKAELARHWGTGIPMKRAGTLFVERFEAERGVSDARRIAEAVAAGDTVLFFPEGTFTREPGLRAFHMGAFVAAAESGVPVIPVVIRGSRSMLRADSWFPRLGHLEVTILPAITPSGTSWANAVRLREAVRNAMLARCGEPDLLAVAASRVTPADELTPKRPPRRRAARG